MKTIVCVADGGGWKGHFYGGISIIADQRLVDRICPEWPEPLRGLVSGGVIRAICVRSLYEAAAVIVADAGQNVCGVAIDAGMLTLHEAGMVGSLRKIGRVPVWILPGRADERWAQKALQEGALRWDEACRVLEKSWADEGPRIAGGFDNAKLQNPSGKAGLPVTSQDPVGYDESSTDPLLSEQEIKALLGVAE